MFTKYLTVRRKITPNNIQNLDPGQIFVFGSNIEGFHGKGAAKLAFEKFGAEYYKGFGLQGSSFAIPTVKMLPTKTTLPVEKIQEYIWMFLDHAEKNKNLTYFVTEIGCGLAGLTPEIIAPLFGKNFENVYLPERFWNVNDKSCINI